ncbi:hypothetical protein BC941DRAFT_469940 [Chlamydoabsidia padenii]|nr:hypothetical protein BC941DRAFT_469940 [Chlamydoabsidia padenii]
MDSSSSTQKKKKRRNTVSPSLVSPVKDEDDEILPSYTCSVMKSGMMMIKREMDHHNQPSTNRRWKRHFVQLHGTLLAATSTMRTPTSVLLMHGLQGAEVGWAYDYPQRPYTIRLYSPRTGEQILLRPRQDEYRLAQMVEWIEQIQAAINISMDIDHQRMPNFVTLARTHYRHHPNMATVIIGQSKLAIQTCPHRGQQVSSSSKNKWGLFKRRIHFY